MTVTKRTRFEVLRRDEHTCQYCGGKAPDVVLQIDHVVPVALGGDDKPSNLVTACKDCNAGKSSIPPDSPIVQGLSDRAAAYALGMADKMTRFRGDLESLTSYTHGFHDIWDLWRNGEGIMPLPVDYRTSLFRWMQMGVPLSVFVLAVPSANQKYNRERYMQPEDVFPYMSGIVWNMINSREIDYSVTSATAAVYTQADADRLVDDAADDAYTSGFNDGQVFEHDRFDLVAAHIDGRRKTGMYGVMSDPKYIPWMQDRGAKDGA